MSPISTWSRCHRHWATPIVVIALLVGSLAPGFVKPVAADSGYSISGTVTGPDGVTPLPNINVHAKTDASDVWTTTGSDGHYSLTVAPGDYTLWFDDSSSAYATGCYSSSGFTGFTNDQRACTPVSVPPDKTDANVQIPYGYSISGTVTGPGGTPLVGVGVGAWCMAANFWCLVGTSTAADGSYVIEGLPAGSYKVGFSTGPTNVWLYYSASGTGGFTASRDAATQLSLPPDATGINVELPLGYSISGTVTGPGGAPLANIRVFAYSTAGRFGIDTAGVSTAADGSYTIGGFPADSYRVSFWDPSGTYASGHHSTAGFTADPDAATPVGVPPNATGIDVQLPIGLHISGMVTDPDGDPLPNIQVNANAGNFGAGTQTAIDGTYALTVLPGGDYRVSFHDASSTYVDGCYASSGFTTDQNACTPVSVPPDATGINVVMPLGRHISGTVTGSDGKLLANIQVNANAGNFGTGTQTRSDGTYSLMVLPGSYTLRFQDSSSTYVDGCYSSSGFTPDEYACTPVTVTTGDVTGIDVQMPLGLRLSGTVTGPGGTPLVGIWVSANGGAFGYGFGSSTNTDSNGTYSLTVLPGNYILRFGDGRSTYVSGCYASSGFATDQSSCTPVSVTTGDVTGIDVAMPLGLHIEGRVTGSDGTPLANIGVGYNAWSPFFWIWYGTAPDGTYSLAVLPGDYTVSFYGSSTYVDGCYSSSGFTTDPNACTPVGVTTGDVTGIDVAMPLARHISGTVTGSDGTPLANIGVGANAGTSWFFTNTGADGTYSLMVVPGSYALWFWDNSSTYAWGCYASGGLTIDENACAAVTASTADVTGLDVVMPLAGATPAGTDVPVVPAVSSGAALPVSLTFSHVDTAGTTSLTTSPTAPALPAGYQIGDPSIYYDFQTTATYTGTITVCISYGLVSPPPTSLLHYENGAWADVTTSIDTVHHEICGTTTSLGLFALATWAPPVLTVPSNVIATATGSTGAVVTYSATALDSAGTPLTPACTKASGSTFPVGTTTVTCAATDTNLRTSSASFTVTVGYGFAGFFQPLNDPISSTNPMSVFKDGSTIPVKFALTYADGTPILDPAAAAIATACGATISLAQTSGTAGPVDEVVTSTTPNSGTCFRYDATAHQFIFNLGTKGLPTGTQYVLKVSIVGPAIVGPDGTLRPTHELNIGLR